MSIKVYSSPFKPIPLVQEDLLSFLFSNPYKVSSQQPIFRDAVSQKVYSYAEVVSRTKSLAHGLRGLGIRPDDVIALVSPNSIDYAIICYAVLGCGATVSPMNAALTAEEVEAQLRISEAKYLIAHSSLLDAADQATKNISIRGIIQADDARATRSTCLTSVPKLIASSPGSDLVKTPRELLDKRPAFICFSSGTTGAAKGVMITHKNLTVNIQQWEETYFRDEPPSRTGIAFLPFSHIYGINVFVCGALFRGQQTIILSRFDLDIYLRSIEQFKPTELYLVPPIALVLVKDPRAAEHNLSSVRKIMSAAAPLSVELATALETSLKSRYGCNVYCYQSWGLTETSPLATGVPTSRMDKRWTVGQVSPHLLLRFVNPDTMKDMMETDEHGTLKAAEIWCCGPNVVNGYYRNDHATSEAFEVDEEGRRWFRTGDIGAIDKEGFVTIQDRIKEMIKYKGLQVIPSELEGKLLQHPDIDDCAVTSIWDESQATELPVGYIVLNEKAKLRPQQDTRSEINQWLNGKIANHKKLRGGIKFINVIPKSPSGKLLRRTLKSQAQSEHVLGARL